MQMRLSNVLCFENVTCDLTKPGVTLVYGRNTRADYANSNGVGKTALFCHAPQWVLYGKYLGMDAVTDVVRTGADKAIGEIWTTDVKGRPLYVKRERAASGGGNLTVITADGEQSWDAAQAQTNLEVLFGVTQAQFTELLMFTGTFSFASLGDAAIKQQLSALLPINVERLLPAANARLKRAETDAVGVAAAQRTTTDALAALTDQKSAAEANVAAWEEHRNNSVTNLKDRATQQIAFLASQQAAAEKLQATLASQDHVMKLREQASQLETAVTMLRYKIQQSRSTEQQLIQQENTLSRRCKDTTMLVCTACGQVLSDEQKAQARSTAEAELKTLQEQVVEAHRNYVQLQSESETKLANLTQLRKEIATYPDSWATAQRELNTVQQRCAQTSSTIAAIQAELHEKSSQENPHVVLLKSLIDRETTFTKQLESLAAEKVTREHTRDLWEFVAQMVGKSGITHWMLLQLLPQLTHTANRLLSYMSPEHLRVRFTSSGKRNDKIRIEAESAVGGKKFIALSAGERRRVEAAVFMAVQELASKFTRQLPWIVLDELLDVSMDSVGKTTLLSGLPEIAHQRGINIVVITNDPEIITDRRAVSTVVCIEAKPGVGSYVTEV